LLAHFAAAARACAPLPFYVYEFEARSGYAVRVEVLEQLRAAVGNFAGLKVSDRPFEAVEPYLLDGLDVFVGAEELVPAGLARGAAGAVSGLASVFPERVVALVGEGANGVRDLRAELDRYPFQAAAKFVLGRRGVPVREDVRAPLRTLTDDEKRRLDAWLESS
jgi:4-hydroxy-tetrahydrodipicolinate synthase